MTTQEAEVFAVHGSPTQTNQLLLLILIELTAAREWRDNRWWRRAMRRMHGWFRRQR